jgi:hypothetical protein
VPRPATACQRRLGQDPATWQPRASSGDMSACRLPRASMPARTPRCTPRAPSARARSRPRGAPASQRRGARLERSRTPDLAPGSASRSACHARRARSRSLGIDPDQASPSTAFSGGSHARAHKRTPLGVEEKPFSSAEGSRGVYSTDSQVISTSSPQRGVAGIRPPWTAPTRPKKALVHLDWSHY